MMPKHLFLTILIVTLGHGARGAKWFNDVEENPDYPGKCYENDDVFRPLVLADGASMAAPPGHCFEVSCSRKDDGKFSLTYSGCGKVGAPPGCRVVKDTKVRYPGCCPTFKCDN